MDDGEPHVAAEVHHVAVLQRPIGRHLPADVLEEHRLHAGQARLGIEQAEPRGEVAAQVVAVAAQVRLVGPVDEHLAAARVPRRRRAAHVVPVAVGAEDEADVLQPPADPRPGRDRYAGVDQRRPGRVEVVDHDGAALPEGAGDQSNAVVDLHRASSARPASRLRANRASCAG
jgi:hypothetical protein